MTQIADVHLFISGPVPDCLPPFWVVAVSLGEFSLTDERNIHFSFFLKTTSAIGVDNTSIED